MVKVIDLGRSILRNKHTSIQTPFGCTSREISRILVVIRGLNSQVGSVRHLGVIRDIAVSSPVPSRETPYRERLGKQRCLAALECSGDGALTTYTPRGQPAAVRRFVWSVWEQAERNTGATLTPLLLSLRRTWSRRVLSAMKVLSSIATRRTSPNPPDAIIEVDCRSTSNDEVRFVHPCLTRHSNIS